MIYLFHPIFCEKYSRSLSADTEAPITICNLASLSKIIKQTLQKKLVDLTPKFLHSSVISIITFTYLYATLIEEKN